MYMYMYQITDEYISDERLYKVWQYSKSKNSYVFVGQYTKQDMFDNCINLKSQIQGRVV